MNTPSIGNDTLTGTSGDDTIDALAGHDSVTGGGGNDLLQGRSGNDTLDGGTGADLLNGGAGSDTYRIAAGAGLQTIRDYAENGDYDTVSGSVDAVAFLDVASTEVTLLERRLGDLHLHHGTAGRLLVSGHFWMGAVEQFRFSDGVTWNLAAINERVVFMGSEANDTMGGVRETGNRIHGMGGNDRIGGGRRGDLLDGAEGSDKLNGKAGNDTLLGGAGTDILNGGRNDDTLQGGAGSDTMNGERGNDLYLLAAGDGLDWIKDADPFAGNVDVVLFADVASTAVTLEWRVTDLVVTYGDGDQLIIRDHFHPTTPANRIERLEFSDGVVWDEQAVRQRAVNLATDDLLAGTPGDDLLEGGDGLDTLVGHAGADTLDGGPGADTYRVAPGAGMDFIVDLDTVAGSVDAVIFEGIASTEVWALERRQDSLVIGHGASDELTVDNYFSRQAGYVIEQFRFSDGVSWDEAAIKAVVLTLGTAGNDTLNGYFDGPNRSQGFEGKDVVYGGGVDDILDGGAGDDYVGGSRGADTLIGGSGNDQLSGHSGDDIYVLSAGAGMDTIYEWEGTDTIRFTDIVAAQVTSVERTGWGDLSVRYGASDQLTIQYHFSQGQGVEQFQFADGTIWDSVAIRSQTIINGTDAGQWMYGAYDISNRFNGLGGNDILLGAGHADWLDGGSGDDEIFGNGGDDSLTGGSGNDRMGAGPGVDTLDGGPGDDTMDGDAGNDLYVLALGSGVDRIRDFSIKAANLDAVVFLDVPSTAVLPIVRTGNGDALNSLVLRYSATDQVTIEYFFSGSDRVVEEFRFSDGVTWNEAMVKARVSTYGDAAGNNLYGYAGGPNRIHGLDGNDWLVGAEADDVLDGGNGQDGINGRAGNDLLLGGADNDALDGDDGNDTLDAGSGDDVLDGAIGDDSLDGSGGHDRLAGGDGADTLAGGDGDDALAGHAGVDSLQGGAGADLLEGHGSSDCLLGGDDGDSLNGGAGGDTLAGQAGNDMLQGEGGQDRFVFHAGSGNDTVADFSVADGDLIQLIAGINGSSIVDAATALEATQDVDGNAVIDLGAGNAITLTGVEKADLSAASFLF